MRVECGYWSDCGLVGGGCCARGFYGGGPTLGQCAFRCPEGDGPWRGELGAALGGGVAARSVPLVADRPVPNARQVVSFLTAFLTSPRVSRPLELERLAKCAECEYLRRASDSRLDWCGLCGCKVSLEGFRLANLASYVEHLPDWGCKHPRRGELRPDGLTRFGWT